MGKEFTCSSCGKVYFTQRNNFIPSKSSLYSSNNGYITVCKDCVENLFAKYEKFYDGNKRDALIRICQIFDIYFTDVVFDVVEKFEDKQRLLSLYISRIQLRPHAGKTYQDTVKEQKRDSIQSVSDIVENDELDTESMKKSVSVWGFGFTPEQYKILDDQFDDWKSRVVIDSKTRETLVRELCIIKLQMNISLADNNVDLYSKLMKTYQDAMKSANLQPLQVDANDKASEKPLGVMIQMFENERPISDPREEWKDVDGIVRYITIYFLGHLCKMLKLKNRYSAMYEAEMAKYRVEIPELEEADDEDVFDFLVNGGDTNDEETGE